RKPLLSELERDARARAGLEEQVHHCHAAQRRHLLDLPLGDLFERLGGVEDIADLVRREGGESEEILAERKRHEREPTWVTVTSSRPSSSVTATSTRPPRGMSTVLPITSAWIGSSRPPRSTSTAS